MILKATCPGDRGAFGLGPLRSAHTRTRRWARDDLDYFSRRVPRRRAYQGLPAQLDVGAAAFPAHGAFQRRVARLLTIRGSDGCAAWPPRLSATETGAPAAGNCAWSTTT